MVMQKQKKVEKVAKEAKQPVAPAPQKAPAVKGPAEDLIEKYIPFASSIANKIARSLSSDADYDDILCNARLGLLEAARRFDDRFNVDFKTFAYYRIKGAIYDGLRKTGWIPRSIYTKFKMEQAANEYFKGVTERIMDSADSIKSDLDMLSDKVSQMASVYVMSLDNMEEYEVEDKSAKRDIEHKAEFQKIKEKMRDAIEGLPEKERKLVKMYYFQNKTLQEIGERLNLSKSWTSRLHARSLDLLMKKLSGIGGDMTLGEDFTFDEADVSADLGVRA
ncbi:sigma-70 family RNA polymerase sigma factor [bacterium]|nr:sigma-70 family RNA polymerase sigma factor [bacterium]